MGLDIALGAIVLIAALRGFYKGFVLQAVGLAGLVGCVYAADPLRDLGRPYARQYFPKIDGDILDKLLWWAAALVAFLVTTGIASGLVKLARRPKYGLEVEPNRGDQGAGFVLGAAKGVLVVAFALWGIAAYEDHAGKVGGFVEKQVTTSKALELHRKFKPADKVWRTPAVQAFVTRIKSRGLWTKPAEPATSAQAGPLQAAVEGRPQLELPKVPDPADPNFLKDVDRALKAFDAHSD